MCGLQSLLDGRQRSYKCAHHQLHCIVSCPCLALICVVLSQTTYIHWPAHGSCCFIVEFPCGFGTPTAKTLKLKSQEWWVIDPPPGPLSPECPGPLETSLTMRAELEPELELVAVRDSQSHS